MLSLMITLTRVGDEPKLNIPPPQSCQSSHGSIGIPPGNGHPIEQSGTSKVQSFRMKEYMVAVVAIVAYCSNIAAENGFVRCKIAVSQDEHCRVFSACKAAINFHAVFFIWKVAKRTSVPPHQFGRIIRPRQLSISGRHHVLQLKHPATRHKHCPNLYRRCCHH